VGGAEQPGFINIVDVIPVAGIKIRLRDKRVQRAIDLAGRVLRVTAEQGGAVLTVPPLDQYDLLTLELQSDHVPGKNSRWHATDVR
jgi:hypothetical protein